MRTTIRLALPVALLLAASVARAESSEPGGGDTSYRWQVATTDAILMGTAIAGFSLEGKDASLDYVASNTMMTVGGFGYLLGAPIVHATHGRWGRAGLSLLLRVAIPATGATIGAVIGKATCTPGEWFCGLDEMGKGVAVGAVVAAVVDSVLIASPRTARELETERTVARRPSAGASLSPQLVATPNLALVGLGGRF